MFEFPTVTSAGPTLDTQSITLMTGSAQRISVRLQRATTSQATQTDPLWPEHSWGATDGGSHTFPKMKYRTHRKASKNKGFARWENQNDQAASSQRSVDCQEKSVVSGELVHNGITHRGKVREQVKSVFQVCFIYLYGQISQIFFSHNLP